MSGPTATVSKMRKISPIWLVPIVTAIIGGLLIVSHLNNAGYKIAITAENADGLSVGKTAIKNRSVDVGVVSGIELGPGFDHVIIHCTIEKKMSSLLKPDTIFWVVKPRVNMTEVSGLGTIVAGVHIEVQPGKTPVDGITAQYTMLETPPVTADEPGLRVMLNSSLPNVLAVSTPVQLSGYTVGHIETADFDVESRSMRYRVFIRKPYDALVTENTRFWQKNEFDFSLTPAGLNLQLPSLSDLVSGGIGFDLPAGLPAGGKAADNDEYALYPSEKSINETAYTVYREYIMLFDSSIGGLTAEAPVMFRGIRVGTVVKSPHITTQTLADLAKHIAVLIKIEPERISGGNIDFDEIERSLTEGQVRGTLKTLSLITQSLYVDLDVYPDAPDWAGEKEMDGYRVIPTTPGSLDHIQQQIAGVLDKISEMPIEQPLNELTKVLRETRQAAQSLNKYLNDENTRQLPRDIQKSIRQLDEVMRNMQPMLDALNQNSNALIFKVNRKPDVVPKAK